MHVVLSVRGARLDRRAHPRRSHLRRRSRVCQRFALALQGFLIVSQLAALLAVCI